VAFAERLLPALASGDAQTRTAVLKILLGIGDPAGVIKRYIRFSSTLAGFVRDRALDSLREFGSALIEPVIEPVTQLLIVSPPFAVEKASYQIRLRYATIPAATSLRHNHIIRRTRCRTEHKIII